MSTDARNFWDGEIVSASHVAWMGHPLVREYINGLVGGSTPLWPMDWFESWLHGRRFHRALSIGCGSGALERDLIRRNLCDAVDAFDASVGSLAVARRDAAAEGFGRRIRYFSQDFNEPTLPRRKYDVAFFHQSAHHVWKLEKLFKAVMLALRPGGLLYLDEYVGPSRFEWSEERIAAQQAVYAELPRELRLSDRLALPIQMDDPSEAYRSSEIEPQLHIGFHVLARRPYGGALLSLVLPAMQLPAASDALVAGLIARDRTLPAYYAVIVARPRRLLSKAIARFRYFFQPKARRLLTEVRIWLRSR